MAGIPPFGEWGSLAGEDSYKQKIPTMFNETGRYDMESKAPKQSQPVEAENLPHADAIKRQLFPPLEDVSRPALDTVAAAYYLNRRPQTLRTWACFENGPIRPMRINGRLAWRVADIKLVMGV